MLLKSPETAMVMLMKATSAAVSFNPSAILLGQSEVKRSSSCKIHKSLAVMLQCCYPLVFLHGVDLLANYRLQGKPTLLILK